jgi:hypothetical protein
LDHATSVRGPVQHERADLDVLGGRDDARVVELAQTPQLAGDVASVVSKRVRWHREHARGELRLESAKTVAEKAPPSGNGRRL